MTSVIQNWLTIVASYFRLLFDLQIGDTGVVFGHFCIACACFFIAFKFLLGNIAGGTK